MRVRVPFLARWPGRIPAGSVNVLAAFTDTPAQPLRQDLLFQSANGVYAIRSGPWKWIEGVPLAPPGRRPPGRRSPKADQFKPQLIHLQHDPGETTDVSSQHPDVVNRLSAILRRQREQGFSRP